MDFFLSENAGDFQANQTMTYLKSVEIGLAKIGQQGGQIVIRSRIVVRNSG